LKGRRATHNGHVLNGAAGSSSLEIVENLLKNARANYEKALRRVAEIRDAGYPELKCPGISKQIDTDGIPEIALEELQILGPLSEFDVIGEGGMARVYRHELPRVGTIAFKRFSSGIDAEQMKREAAAIFRLRHPNIVHLYGICVEPGYVGLVLEMVDGCSLDMHIYTKPQPTKFSKDRALKIFQQILVGLEFIHSQNHLHLDIKSANVLLTADERVKLSDFGTAQELRMTMAMLTRSPELTLRWAAPERLLTTAVLSPAVDVYSAGMVLVEMMTGEVPFPDVSVFQLTQAILVEKKLPSTLEGVDLYCQKLIEECVQHDPLRRASTNKLLKMVSAELQRECLACCSVFSLFRGVECDCVDGNHFLCDGCLTELMEQRLLSDDPKSITEEGHVPCPSSLGGVISCDDLQGVVADAALLVKWNEKRSKNKFDQAQLKARTRIRELEEEIELGPVRRHVNTIANSILTDACPRCRTAFVDFDGCFALQCSNRKCSCRFCAWCLKDCGKDAHKHVKSCPYKTNNQNYFGTKAEFLSSRKSRQLRLLKDYLAALKDQEPKAKVMEMLKPNLQDFDRIDF
jgi:serine/threonine protein kinase